MPNERQAHDIVILWRGPGLAAFDKPPGCETIAQNNPDPEICFATRVRIATGESDWRPVHRLDRDTSGVVLFADNDRDAERAEQAFRRRRVQKDYLALCLGVPINAGGLIRRALTDWQGGHRPVRVVKQGGRPAETAYRRLDRWRPAPASADATGLHGAADGSESPEGLARPDGPASGLSLLVFSPRQGRTHQIRAHAAAFGHPILGDDQYGDRAANRVVRRRAGLRRQALHAWTLRLPADLTASADNAGGENAIDITAPIPEDLARALAPWFPDWRRKLADAWKAHLNSVMPTTTGGSPSPPGGGRGLG